MKNPSISDMPFSKDCIIINIHQGKVVLTQASRNPGKVCVDGRVYTMNRNAIFVRVFTRFLAGPFNEQLGN